MDFARYRQPLNLVGKSLFAVSCSFDDAHAVAGAVTRGFGEIYNADCVSSCAAQICVRALLLILRWPWATRRYHTMGFSRL